jgi:hypothetical protein
LCRSSWRNRYWGKWDRRWSYQCPFLSCSWLFGSELSATGQWFMLVAARSVGFEAVGVVTVGVGAIVSLGVCSVLVGATGDVGVAAIGDGDSNSNSNNNCIIPHNDSWPQQSPSRRDPNNSNNNSHGTPVRKARNSNASSVAATTATPTSVQSCPRLRLQAKTQKKCSSPHPSKNHLAVSSSTSKNIEITRSSTILSTKAATAANTQQ